MSARWQEELELLRSVYPELEYRLDGDQHWVRLVDYQLPGGWSRAEVELVCRIPSQAGEAPYGFWVRPAISPSDGSALTNTTAAVTSWGGDFLQFSWSPVTWQPSAEIGAGANMLVFLRSIAERLREGG